MGPWVENQELHSLTVSQFFAQLRSAFGDELTQQQALKELETLKQGRRPYQEFYTKFARREATRILKEGVLVQGS